MKKNHTNTLGLLIAAGASLLLTACGGGGGGGSSQPVVYYPYETVYGDVCKTFQATPGCTFKRDGTRITVSEDPDYNKYGLGSDDLWYVKFYSDGTADIYDDLGNYQYSEYTKNFAGWVGGNTIGVGTTGLFWENVANGTYWLGKNGVLYNANWSEANYGKAINNNDADQATDMDFSAMHSQANKALVKAAADKLVEKYGFKTEKATAVASALNSWAVSSNLRGYTTDVDMSRTFKAVFGVEYSSALSAVQALQAGNKDGMRMLTNRSAEALGLKPSQAQDFIKGMYEKALASYGYDADSITW
jgi:hypothetical protein